MIVVIVCFGDDSVLRWYLFVTTMVVCGGAADALLWRWCLAEIGGEGCGNTV